jgi:hypothetical protein
VGQTIRISHNADGGRAVCGLFAHPERASLVGGKSTPSGDPALASCLSRRPEIRGGILAGREAVPGFHSNLKPESFCQFRLTRFRVLRVLSTPDQTESQCRSILPRRSPPDAEAAHAVVDSNSSAQT